MASNPPAEPFENDAIAKLFPALLKLNNLSVKVLLVLTIVILMSHFFRLT
jgi:hypothetical protein